MIDPERNRIAKYLNARLPSMMKEATEKARPKIKVPGGGVKTPCSICLKHYGGVFQANTKPQCPSCRDILKEGWTAIVTRDGRFDFVKDSRLPADWIGAVKVIPSEGFDEFIKQVEISKSNGEQN